MRPSKGDLCWVQGRMKRHYGVCTGAGSDGEPWFIHATIERGVVWTTRKGFAGNKPIAVEVRADPATADTVVHRAAQSVGKPYNAFSANCEHVAREAALGRRESHQLQSAVVLSALTAGFAWLANENGTYVDHGGYRGNAIGSFSSRRLW